MKLGKGQVDHVLDLPVKCLGNTEKVLVEPALVPPVEVLKDTGQVLTVEVPEEATK